MHRVDLYSYISELIAIPFIPFLLEQAHLAKVVRYKESVERDCIHSQLCVG